MHPFPSTAMKGGYAQLTASAAPNPVSGTASNSGAVTVTSSATTVTPAGGQAPYTYAWSVLSGGFAITSPTAASTTFSESLSPGSDSGTARCTVMSTDGQSVTVDVSVSLSNTYVAPRPPVWNVADNTNMITMASGDPTQFVDFHATSPLTSTVIYGDLGGLDYGPGNYGPQPTWPEGTAVANGTGLLAGGASAPPGVYSGTYWALDTADSSISYINITVTIT